MGSDDSFVRCKNSFASTLQDDVDKVRNLGCVIQLVWTRYLQKSLPIFPNIFLSLVRRACSICLLKIVLSKFLFD